MGILSDPRQTARPRTTTREPYIRHTTAEVDLAVSMALRRTIQTMARKNPSPREREITKDVCVAALTKHTAAADKRKRK